MTVIVLLFVALILLWILLRQFMQLQDMDMENQMIQQYLDSFEGLYDVFQEQADSARRYRHDLARHIRTLEEMMKNRQNDEENSELESLTQNLRQQYEESKRKVYCKDDVVNTILAMKVQECEQQGIPLELSIENTDYPGIREMDLVGIIENLLENAIEAQERIDAMKEPEAKKRIFFSMKKQDNQICMELENAIAADEVDNIRLKTRKKNPEEHGIGTKIIDRLVKEYHGENNVAIDAEKKEFRQYLIVKL